MKSFLIHCFLFVSLSSCVVSTKKYNDMVAQKVRMEADLSERTTQLEKANGAISDLTAKMDQLKEDTTNLGIDKRNNKKRLVQLEREYEQLNASYKNLVTSSGKLNRDMEEQREQLLAIQENLERTRQENDSLSVNLAEREKKVKELEQVLANKERSVQSLRSKISNALLNFKESDISVKVKNGKVYVSLAEQLLFGSGSITVDK